MRYGVFVTSLVALTAMGAGYAIYTGVFVTRTTQQSAVIDQNAAPQNASGGIPQTLPEFTLVDRDGARRSIRGWKNRSMIVNFWATWCAPCRREIPLLKELQQAHGKAGFQVVGVAVDFRDDVLKYAAEMGIDYPLLIGEEDGLAAVNSFGMGSVGFPFTVFTDRQHRIITTHLGELTRMQSAVVIDTVTKVNRGELTPAAARTAIARQFAAQPAAAT